ncbi:GNAT family N-acetyltransferase [Ornithinibacillus californiensis]|uniref:GNAT family N-acetyltransferase n=1 Tax=Ornithinibacillus californiensis TaxID=161536 RepID=UPI00064DA55E|nr:GNAT family N-acetyltransferase [Ornithinibacillus californiensis]
MIEFRPITWDNFDECIQLQLTEAQKEYLASNVYSLAQSYVALLNDKLPAMTYAIYHHETMIGFIMMYHDTAEENEYGEEPCYGILRFMIDYRYQNKGYGKQAMKKAIAYLKTLPQGEATAIYLSYAPENTVAKHLYISLGFIETGIISDGESVARLQL